MRQVVIVLHTNNVGDPCLSSIPRAAVTLLKPICRISPLLCRSASTITCAAIDPSPGPCPEPMRPVVNRHQAHRAPGWVKIIVNTICQFLRRNGWLPRLIRRPPPPKLGNNHQLLRIRMQRLPNDLISDMRAIKVRRVDMIHSSRNRHSSTLQPPRPDPSAAPTPPAQPTASPHIPPAEPLAASREMRIGRRVLLH